MDFFVHFQLQVPVLAIALTVMILPVYGQINTPCMASMISSFTPCLSFLANSTANGTSPTADCCNSLRSLTGNGRDCLCLIVTGGVPFNIPINRTLALSLPRACNMPGVPLQCKATGVPIPAPGPVALGPILSPGASPSPSPKGPVALGPILSPGASPSPSPKASVVPEPTPSSEAPESDTTPLLTPSSPTVDTEAPTATTGSRPVLTPSAAVPSYHLSPSVLIFALGLVGLKYY